MYLTPGKNHHGFERIMKHTPRKTRSRDINHSFHVSIVSQGYSPLSMQQQARGGGGEIRRQVESTLKRVDKAQAALIVAHLRDAQYRIFPFVCVV